VFKQDLKSINHLYNDHASTDMSIQEFHKLCKMAWEKSHGFLTIDLTSKPERGKYRIGLDTFYIPEIALWRKYLRYIIKKQKWIL
jgi:hypothetical protein